MKRLIVLIIVMLMLAACAFGATLTSGIYPGPANGWTEATATEKMWKCLQALEAAYEATTLSDGNYVEMTNGGKLDNSTDGTLKLMETSEDLTLAFTSNTLTLGSGTSLDTINVGGLNLTATGDIVMTTAKYIESDTTTAHTNAVRVYDNDTGPGYKTVLSWTNGNTPAVVLGNANGTTALTSSDWSIDATGAVAGISYIGFDSGSKLYLDNVAVSNAEIKTLYSAPKVLVTGVSGSVIDVVSVVIFYDYATAGFNAVANNMGIYYTNGSGAACTGTIAQNAFINATADRTCKLLPVAVASTASTGIVSQDVVLAVATADPTTGGGTLRVAISYRVVPSAF